MAGTPRRPRSARRRGSAEGHLAVASYRRRATWKRFYCHRVDARRTLCTNPRGGRLSANDSGLMCTHGSFSQAFPPRAPRRVRAPDGGAAPGGAQGQVSGAGPPPAALGRSSPGATRNGVPQGNALRMRQRARPAVRRSAGPAPGGRAGAAL